MQHPAVAKVFEFRADVVERAVYACFIAHGGTGMEGLGRDLNGIRIDEWDERPDTEGASVAGSGSPSCFASDVIRRQSSKWEGVAVGLLLADLYQLVHVSRHWAKINGLCKSMEMIY